MGTEIVKPKRKTGAPKGNQNAVGNQGGRERTYTDPELFAQKVEEYLATAPTPSIIGISLHLGFSDRDTFASYATAGVEFARTIQKAKMRIEQDRIERLNDKSRFTPGTIFDLKNNYGWVDQQTVNMTVTHEDRLDRVRERLNGIRPSQQLAH